MQIKPFLFYSLTLCLPKKVTSHDCSQKPQSAAQTPIGVHEYIFKECIGAKFTLGNKQLENHLWQPEVIYDFFL